MRQTFIAFNGLRLFAALSVVCYHYLTLTSSFRFLPLFIQNFVHSGPVALEFFFILSGYVLTHAYLERPLSKSTLRRSFWLARFSRLYPVYLFAFVLFLPIAYEKYFHNVVGVDSGRRTFLAGGMLGLVALQSWTQFSQAWNGPSWSLSVEAFFYFLFPFVLLPISRLPWKRVVFAILVLWITMIGLDIAHHHSYIPAEFWHNWVMYHPLFWSPMFFVGIASYRLSGVWMQLQSLYSSLIAAISAGLLILLCGALPPAGSDYLVYGGAAPLIVLIIWAFSGSGSGFSKFLAVKPLYQLGAASYITYIVQAPVWHIFRRVTDMVRHSRPDSQVVWWQFLGYIALILPLSIVIQRLVEEPARNWLQTNIVLIKRSANAGTFDAATGAVHTQ